MIELGLGRISTLLKSLGNPQNSWKAIHVAGTNGKGSICAYISNCLNEIAKTGRFTSPHLINRWDCIWIDGKSVCKDVFINIENKVKLKNETEKIGATEFEILTATAFEIFRQQQVTYAVIEVGLGGKRDSTNILSNDNTLVSVIGKIGMDHESFLGNNLTEIANEKAGIIKSNVPSVVDGTNDVEALEAVKSTAAEVGSQLTVAEPDQLPYNDIQSPLLGSYQLANLSCALNVLRILKINEQTVKKGVSKVSWPGRLQWVNHDNKNILVDGAHNPQSAQLLKQYIDENIKTPRTIVMAFSQGKDSESIIKEIVQKGDNIITTTFGPVDTMPWVKPQNPFETKKIAEKYCDNVSVCENNNEIFGNCPTNTVICGSLYLVADVLRHCNYEP